MGSGTHAVSVHAVDITVYVWAALDHQEKKRKTWIHLHFVSFRSPRTRKGKGDLTTHCKGKKKVTLQKLIYYKGFLSDGYLFSLCRNLNLSPKVFEIFFSSKCLTGFSHKPVTVT